MQLESDYNGGPWPWLQEGDLGGVSCGLGDKRQKAAVYGEHWGDITGVCVAVAWVAECGKETSGSVTDSVKLQYFLTIKKQHCRMSFHFALLYQLYIVGILASCYEGRTFLLYMAYSDLDVGYQVDS